MVIEVLASSIIEYEITIITGILEMCKICDDSNYGDNNDFPIDGENKDNDKALLTILILITIMIMMFIIMLITVK